MPVYFCVDKFSGKSTSGKKISQEDLRGCAFEPKSKCDLELYKCDEHMIGGYCPKCTEDGNYESTQCHGSTGFCWCVESLGQGRPSVDILPQADDLI